MKNILIVLFAVMIGFISCKKENAVNETEKKIPVDTVKQDVYSDIIGFYKGTAKDKTPMELTIEKALSGDISGHNAISWNPANPLRAAFIGRYDKDKKKVLLYEDNNVKGAGYFTGDVKDNGTLIDGEWFRYSDNGSYKWILYKVNKDVNTEGNEYIGITNFDEAALQSSDFATFMNEFAKVINCKNVEVMNRFVDANYGIYVYYNPGAFIYAYHYNNFSEIFNAKDDYAANCVKEISVTCVFKKGSLPIFNCENEKWNKTGCFWSNVNGARLVKTLNTTKQFGGDNISQKQMENAALIDRITKYEFFSTFGGFGIYFAFENGKWIITAFDCVSNCDA